MRYGSKEATDTLQPTFFFAAEVLGRRKRSKGATNRTKEESKEGDNGKESVGEKEPMSLGKRAPQHKPPAILEGFDSAFRSDNLGSLVRILILPFAIGSL